MVHNYYLHFVKFVNFLIIISLKREIRLINPLTPVSDQDRISPNNINTKSIKQVMRITKNINQVIRS